MYHKKTVISIVVLLFIAFALLPMIGGEFMPQTDEGKINLTIECASGISLTHMRKTVIDIEESIKQDIPEITTVMFQFGAQSGFNPNSSKSNTISVTIKLVPQKERSRSQKQIEMVLRKRLDQIPGISYSIRAGGMMGSGESAIVKIIGDVLKAKAIAERYQNPYGKCQNG